MLTQALMGEGNLEPSLHIFEGKIQDRYILCSDGLSGMARGIDAQGALLLETAQGVQKISSAEVSVRPA